MCYTLFFWVSYESGTIFSLVLHLSKFQQLYIHFTVSRARPFWPEGRYPTGRICSNGPSFLSIISDDSKEYSTRMVRKRKYRRYWDNSALLQKTFCNFSGNILHFYQKTLCKFNGNILHYKVKHCANLLEISCIITENILQPYWNHPALLTLLKWHWYLNTNFWSKRFYNIMP